jgi:hypothetical protein
MDEKEWEKGKSKGVVRDFFHCYIVHVVELLNYYTNHCKYIKFTHLNIKNAPTCFGPRTIIRELYIPC